MRHDLRSVVVVWWVEPLAADSAGSLAWQSDPRGHSDTPAASRMDARRACALHSRPQ